MTQRTRNERQRQVAADLHYTRLEFGAHRQPGHAIICVRLPITASAVAAIAADLFELSTVFAENSEPPPVFSITPGKIVRKRAHKRSKNARPLQ